MDIDCASAQRVINVSHCMGIYVANHRSAVELLRRTFMDCCVGVNTVRTSTLEQVLELASLNLLVCRDSRIGIILCHMTNYHLVTCCLTATGNGMISYHESQLDES